MKNGKSTNQEELVTAAKAWAEFFYAEYCLEKTLQNMAESNTMELATNHDKLST
jgi:hypothetical protein